MRETGIRRSSGRRRWARLVAGLAMGGAVTVGPLAAPAPAAEAPVIEFDFATNAVSPGSLSGRAFMPSGLNSIVALRLEIRSVDRGGVSGRVVCNPCDGSPNSVPFAWPTPVFDYNGAYELKVIATGREVVELNGDEDSVATRVYRQRAPAAPPSGVKAVTEPDRSVTITWSKVTAHPDVTGYEVRRKAPGASAYVLVGVVPQPSGSGASVGDSVPAGSTGGGVYEYEVRTIREGEYPGSADSRVYSAPAGASATVPAPSGSSTTTTPSTTTTTKAGNGSQPGSTTPTTTQTGNQGGGQTTGTTTPFTGSPLPTSDLRGFLNNQPSPSTSVRAPTRGSTVPDTYNPDLPYAPGRNPVEGRQEGRSSGAAGTGAVSRLGDDDEANRRALLIPVAAGTILVVAALHLRWLSRRMATAPVPPGGSGGRRRRSGGDPSPGDSPAYPPGDGDPTLAHAPLVFEPTDDDGAAYEPAARPVGAGNGYEPAGSADGRRYDPSAYDPAGEADGSYVAAGYDPAAYDPAGYRPDDDPAYDPADDDLADYELADYDLADYELAPYDPADYEAGYDPAYSDPAYSDPAYDDLAYDDPVDDDPAGVGGVDGARAGGDRTASGPGPTDERPMVPVGPAPAAGWRRRFGRSRKAGKATQPHEAAPADGRRGPAATGALGDGEYEYPYARDYVDVHEFEDGGFIPEAEALGTGSRRRP